jgi:hypothetical protein
MESKYAKRAEHFVRLFLYTYNPNLWSNRQEHEGEALRELKKNPTLLKSVADICSAEATGFLQRVPVRDGVPSILSSDIDSFRESLEKRLLGNDIKSKYGAQTMPFEMLCDNIAFYVGEALNYFLQNRAN